MISLENEVGTKPLSDEEIEAIIGRPLRRYERAWVLLKKNLVLKLEVTNSDKCSVYHSHANTIKRAIQKEKYIDTAFKLKHPYAVINCTKLEKEKVIAFSLELNDIDQEGLDALTGIFPLEK